ncbi:Retrovirus-related Pol polyprotein from transposon TNT 1-94 [Senna tora]|uniref:Retrovirus-related Pol polyprotein from transposon TNT 1-94 n=1 Tax=Senna tora TaxID=362788 RepID=A0A835CEL8_9FABA|nr:Retrovirus-related Pol polyprotein from transposon TNT 1-94 [Senna tora]
MSSRNTVVFATMTSTVDSPALNTRGPVQKLQQQGVPTTKYCDHCHKKGHTKDTCWEIHGFGIKEDDWQC